MRHRLPRLIGPIAFLPLVLCASAAAAQLRYERFRIPERQSEAMLSPEHNRCQQTSSGATNDIRACSYQEERRLDVRVNAAYRAAIARLPTQAAKTRLDNLQRRWLATRWNGCGSQADLYREGGSAALLGYDWCRLREMTRRIAWLERYGRRR